MKNKVINNTNIKKKFIIKESSCESDMCIVFKDYFDDIESREEALYLAMNSLAELHFLLLEEAAGAKPLKIGNMKAVTGLSRTLEELDKRWPFLLVEIRAVPRIIGGTCLHTC